MRRLEIIDEDTQAARSEVGIVSRQLTHACADCRFFRYGHRCDALGGRDVERYVLNRDGRCPHWEPTKAFLARMPSSQSTAFVKTHPAVKAWAWTSSIAIIYLVLRILLWT